jgi:hypothetical protein
MDQLALEWGGTLFIRCAVSNQQNSLMQASRLERLPAIVCFREGVIADKTSHPHQIQQFTAMGQIGQVVFEAWLQQSGMLVKTPQATAVARYLAADQNDAEDEEAEEEDGVWGGRGRLVNATAASDPRAPGAFSVSSCGCDEDGCGVDFQHSHLLDLGE